MAMEVAVEQEKKETIEDLLNSAYEHGEFGLFKLNNVSYYPSIRVQKKYL